MDADEFARRTLEEGAANVDRQIGGMTIRYHLLRFVFFLGSAACITRASSVDVSFAKLVLWAALCEICGFATMTGPLGMGHALWTPLWFRLTPGTLKQPLLAALGRRRSWLDVGVFCAYLGLALHALAAPDAELLTQRARRATAALALLCTLDRTAYVGGLGAYYFPLLVCVAWPGVGSAVSVAALQAVQMMHLALPGLAKAGPWFAHVTPTMLAACPWLRWRAIRLSLFRRADPSAGQPADLRPNALAAVVAVGGCATETIVPFLWLCAPRVRLLGVALAIGMHAYIMAMFPVGAVLEWNLVNAAAEAYLFVHHTGDASLLLSPTCHLDLPLLLFVLCTSIVGPILAHTLLSDALSNHFALRKYTGNHPFHTFLVRRDALSKLDALPTARRLAPAASTSHDEPEARTVVSGYGALGTLIRGRLNTKPLCHLLLRACAAGRTLAVSRQSAGCGSVGGSSTGGSSTGGSSVGGSSTGGSSTGGGSTGGGSAAAQSAPLGEYERLDAAHFLSQSLLDVSFVDGPLHAELARACGLSAGELLSLTVCSFPTAPYMRSGGVRGVRAAYCAEWRVEDACSGVVLRGHLATDLLGRHVVVCEDGRAVQAVDANGQHVALPAWATTTREKSA